MDNKASNCLKLLVNVLRIQKRQNPSLARHPTPSIANKKHFLSRHFESSCSACFPYKPLFLKHKKVMRDLNKEKQYFLFYFCFYIKMQLLVFLIKF